MQQRVCIARALICEPDVLLMDEPFSAVDALTRAILQELILKIWETIPVTILFVTHDVDEAVFLSNRIISLSKAPATIREDVTIDLPYPRDQIRTPRGRALHKLPPPPVLLDLHAGEEPARDDARSGSAPRPQRMKKRWPGFLLFAAAAAGLGSGLRAENCSIRSRCRASASIAVAWIESLRNGQLLNHLLPSLWRIFAGFGLAVVVAVPLGPADGHGLALSTGCSSRSPNSSGRSRQRPTSRSPSCSSASATR